MGAKRSAFSYRLSGTGLIEVAGVPDGIGGLEKGKLPGRGVTAERFVDDLAGGRCISICASKKKWCAWRDSNPRPLAPQASALIR